MRRNGMLFLGTTCIIIMQVVSFSIKAQVGPAGVQDTTGTELKAGLHSFYAGAGYGNNMLYLGTTMSQDNSFGYASASYGFADKIYISATGYTISNFSPLTAFYSIGISFTHAFNSWFDISSGLSRYDVAVSLRDTLFSNFTYADATLGFDWRILYTKLSAGGLFADGGQFYMQIRNSRYFETGSFARDKAFFSFDPYVNCLFGTMLTIRTSDGLTETTLSPGYKPWRKRGQVPGPVPVTAYSKFFGAMEIDFGIPVGFSYDFFTLEIEPGYVIPLYSEEGSSGTSGFLLTASLFFRIF